MNATEARKATLVGSIRESRVLDSSFRGKL